MVAASLMNRGFTPRYEGVQIFHDGVALPRQIAPEVYGNRIEFSSSKSLYTYDNGSTEFGFRGMTVGATGVALKTEGSSAIMGSADIEYAGGRMYSTTGVVINPATPVQMLDDVGSVNLVKNAIGKLGKIIRVTYMVDTGRGIGVHDFPSLQVPAVEECFPRTRRNRGLNRKGETEQERSDCTTGNRGSLPHAELVSHILSHGLTHPSGADILSLITWTGGALRGSD